MKWAILPLLLVCGAVSADMYRCVQDGKTSYQEQPCDKESRSTRMKNESGDGKSLVGCYDVRFGLGSRQKLEIKPAANGEFTWSQGGTSIMMKRATAEKLQGLREQVPIDVSDGITAKRDKDDPEKWIMGFFRGTQRNGEEVVFMVFPLANGLGAMEKIACP